LADRRWTRLASRVLIDRWWMRLREDRVRLPSGHVIEEFHVTDYPDWAAVIAMSHGEVVLVEQYRYGVDRMSVEFPAGAVDPGEDPETTARRELLEETGYAADTLVHLGSLAAEPSRATNFGHFFVAPDARHVAEPVTEDAEDLRVLLVPTDEVLRMADDGGFVHGLHAAAAFWAHRRGLLE
jgi:8-oxo-dGTP pyrophosphatase MutT (NUDIX family)